MIDGVLQTLNFSKKSSDIHLFVRLVSGSFNNNAVFPIRLVAKQSAEPVKKGVLNVAREGKIILPDSVSVLILVEDPFCDHQLIAVLVEGYDK